MPHPRRRRWLRGTAQAARLLAGMGRAVRDLVYPPLCLVCDADLGESDARFCAACLAEIASRADEPVCQRCAATVGPYTDTSAGCPECRGHGLRFDAAVRLGRYTGKLRRCCLDFKLSRNELLAPALARVLMERRGEALRACAAGLVVAVPLHFMRRLQRGFNQAESLARHIAAELQVPHRSRILKRTRTTLPQSELKRDDRLENVRGAFRARPAAELRGATVLLVDDILTTGATCSEAARALKALGARRVVVVVLARSQELAGA